MRTELVVGARAVLTDRGARPWIAALVLVEMLDPLEVFEPVWLTDVVGATQSSVAVHVAVGTAASLAALVVLDRWLEFHDARPVLLAACAASLVLFPAWLWVPGFGAKLVLVVAREAATAPLWPIVHARALAAIPGRGGAVTAVTATLGLLPLHAGFAWLAGRIGLTTTMLWLQVAATGTVLWLVRRAPRREPVTSVEP